MYRSTRAQLLNAEKEAINDKRIGSEINQMIRNQMLMQGITPITIEQEQPSIEQERAYIMSQLKSITTQPSKFYNYLYRTNQISDFSKGIDEFIRKKLKYKRNLSYTTLINEWEQYTMGDYTSTSLAEMKDKYDKIDDRLLMLGREEKLKRQPIYIEKGTEGNLMSEIAKDYSETAKMIKNFNRFDTRVSSEDSNKIIDTFEEVGVIFRDAKAARDLTSLQNISRKMKTIKNNIKSIISKYEEQENKRKEENMRKSDLIKNQIKDIKREQVLVLDKIKNDRNLSNEEINQLRIQNSEYNRELNSLDDELKMLGSGLKRKMPINNKTSKKRVILSSNKVIYPVYQWDWR